MHEKSYMYCFIYVPSFCPPTQHTLLYSFLHFHAYFITMNSLNLLILHLLIFVFPICFSSSDIVQWYDSCAKNFTCGDFTVGFPFWGGSVRPKECGYPELQLTCEDEINPAIQIANIKFYVKEINQTSKVLRIAREDLTKGICLQKFENTTLDFKRFYYASGTQNITVLYGCPPIDDGYGTTTSYNGQFTCRITGVTSNIGGYQSGATGPTGCYTSVTVPVLGSSEILLSKNSISLHEVLDKGFEVYYKEPNVDETLCTQCELSKGHCVFDVSKNASTCVCPDGSSVYTSCSLKSQISSNPSVAGHKSVSKAVIVGVSVGGGLIAALLAACLFMVRKRKRILSQTRTKDLSAIIPSSNGFNSSRGYTTTSPSTYLSHSTPSYPSSKSDLENNSSYLGIKLFSYGELEEATENFSQARELGDGGFGTVYYGELQDGRVVAVKRLYENSVKRMGQFMNEVQILARLRHDNLVTLFGCTSKRSRDLLLVYEYIPNGTVADHLHGRLSVSNKLPWSIRLSIAVETAGALAFLHENDVIHRDVKTNNILLDNDFRVKVADFGLSRLFPTDVTHVSTAPQGTPGYVDPDYYQCYHLTEKSDVYSFGVVMIELISSKVAVDITRHRHDINLSNMAIDRIQKNALHELVDPYLGYDEDCVVQKMVKSTAELAFRCLHQDKETRPLMKEVLESLKEIQKTMVNAQNQVVVDIQESDDDVGLLKNDPPFSPEKEVKDNR